jgi:hypothetical protein
MKNYTPLVISGNDKNMQLTLLIQRKLALTTRIHFLRYSIIGFQKWPCPLFSPKTSHTCHQKPIPPSETVPLKKKKG